MSVIDLKIAYIGGGSRAWARKLMMDLALCPELAGEIALYDIDVEAAHLNEQLGNWLQEQPGVVSRWRYWVVPTLAEVLSGADFVIISIQPGSLEVMGEEIAIAEQYGLYFPVGDTTGAPGLVRGLRSATIYAGFADAIAEICPRAWVISYTNPMAICTRTLAHVAPQVKVFGCCHEVFAVQKMLAGLVGKYWDVSTPPRDEIKVNVLGINHFTWFDKATWKGRDLLELVRQHLSKPGVLRPYTQAEVESWNDWFHCEDQVKFTLFQRFGILAAAGDRHLVEFLPGFILSPETLFKWGVIRTPVSYRIQRWESAPQATRDLIEGRTPLKLEASEEEGVGMIKALLGLGDMVSNVNLKNQGQIANLPQGVVVETNAHFSRDEVRPLAAGSIPPGLLPLIQQHSANQELIIEAALTDNTDLAFQAFFNDPSNHLPLDDSWELFNKMLELNKEHLPAMADV
ncbi:MAG: alpha-glucosidase/alpha-galactosidase [Chloroflexota bacterium]